MDNEEKHEGNRLLFKEGWDRGVEEGKEEGRLSAFKDLEKWLEKPDEELERIMDSEGADIIVKKIIEMAIKKNKAIKEARISAFKEMRDWAKKEEEEWAHQKEMTNIQPRKYCFGRIDAYKGIGEFAEAKMKEGKP